ncbi:hypothetical protein Q9290_08275, partial [Oceanimonas sp. CHS3-5]|uniref:hypothetical protein n=1 Tax=Oceanimonas sp. CHS3-5 TaxID=3068186 RepID=UPI002740096B
RREGHEQGHRARYACSPAGQLRAPSPVGTACSGSDLINSAADSCQLPSEGRYHFFINTKFQLCYYPAAKKVGTPKKFHGI